MGRKKKEKINTKTIYYQVSLGSEEDRVRLADYLKKEYNIVLPIPNKTIYPRWFMFVLPGKDDIIDKKFNSVIRNDPF